MAVIRSREDLLQGDFFLSDKWANGVGLARMSKPLHETIRREVDKKASHIFEKITWKLVHLVRNAHFFNKDVRLNATEYDMARKVNLDLFIHEIKINEQNTEAMAVAFLSFPVYGKDCGDFIKALLESISENGVAKEVSSLGWRIEIELAGDKLPVKVWFAGGTPHQNHNVLPTFITRTEYLLLADMLAIK